MQQLSSNLMVVDAEFHAPVVVAQLVRFHFAEPINNVTRADDSYRLDLCLTPRPRNARACYTNHWSSKRFERIGNLFLLPPGEPLLARSDGNCEQSSLICHVQPDALGDWAGDGPQWNGRRLQATLDIRNAHIHSLLLRLAEEARHPGFASEMLIELITAQIAIELARYCSLDYEEPKSGGLAPWRLRLIDERLQEENQTPSLTELAQLCRLSVRQLTRGFRISRGCSIGDYVARSRIEYAKQMLADTDSIKSIAYTLGFASPSSFCYAFRRATGETPGQFRHQLHATGNTRR